jgi:hypothetical protein
MKVLVACEFSGVVRRAFRDAGHEAWSCDLLPAEDGDPHHFTCDIADHLARGLFGVEWDLMIAHPPCTFLANSGNKHLYIGMKKANGIDPARWNNMTAAAHFFRELANAPISRIAIENPVMREPVQRVGRRPDQTIQPWQFGHGEIKRTCFWLKNLPPLLPTKIVEGRRARVHHEPPSAERWKNRSRTYEGIAAAMAAQWGQL